ADRQTSPTSASDLTPEFSAIFNDPDSGDTATACQIQVSTSSTYWSSPLWDSGKATMATTTQGTRSPDISYTGPALFYNGATYFWRIKFWDVIGHEGMYSTSTASFTMLLDNAPIAPTSLLVESQANPVNIATTVPRLSAIYNDPDAIDTAIAFRIQVSASSTNWNSDYLMWDSGKSAMATTTQGTRSPDISYNGTPMSLDGSMYWWRIKFWDALSVEGIFSTSTDSFALTDNRYITKYAYNGL